MQLCRVVQPSLAVIDKETLPGAAKSICPNPTPGAHLWQYTFPTLVNRGKGLLYDTKQAPRRTSIYEVRYARMGQRRGINNVQ
jgi:hypothetical protein